MLVKSSQQLFKSWRACVVLKVEVITWKVPRQIGNTVRHMVNYCGAIPDFAILQWTPDEQSRWYDVH